MAAEKGEMTFWDHLEELRGMLWRCIIATCLLSVIFLSAREWLFKAILWPVQSDFILYKALGLDFSMELINIDISAQFFVYLKMALLCGVVLAFPYLIFEIWRFIKPALYDNEKKAVGRAFGMSSGLFYLGVAVGYFVVLPVCLMFFMNFSVSASVKNTISLNSYISLFVSMVFLIGLIFEFPTVIMVLSHLGLVGRDDLKGYRKYAFVVVLILSALITPSDPFSMFVLAVPLYGLYEFSILICKKKEPDDLA